MYMERYAIRALKSIIYFILVMALVIVLFYFIQGGEELTFKAYAGEARVYQLIILGLAFGLSYPFIGFGKKKIYLNKTFAQEKQAIVDIFGQYGYELTYETETSVFFRPSNRLKRFFDQFFEDTIEVNHKDNPIVIKGLRKRIVRVSLSLENYILNEKR